MGRTRIDQLADHERARFNEWADKWIDVGLRTGPADREKFVAAVKECYRFAGIPFPDVVVWVPSPLVLALAAPAAALAIELIESETRTGQRPGRVVAVGDAVDGAVGGAVDDAVRGAVGDAVRGAVRDAVDDAVDDAVRGAVGDAVRGAVRGAVGGAVDDAVDDAVGGAVGDAVRGAVGRRRHEPDEIRRATLDAIARGWSNYLGGQFWVGGWYWGGAWTSFFREVMQLELPGDLWDRARAYEATMESACWWWPHRRFVMVCERPLAIHRELSDPAIERGWNSHRLHSRSGPAVVWPDGWGLHVVHGVRVPAQVVEAPETMTAKQILDEPNAEVRRIMVQQFGAERFITDLGAKRIQADDYGELYRVELEEDEPLVMVRVINSTPEPEWSEGLIEQDGAWYKRYMIRVPPDVTTAREAVAWTFGIEKAKDYSPLVET